MKFFFDNNLSPHLAKSIASLCQHEPDVLQVIHLRDRFERDVKDAVWIPALAENGDR